MDQDMAATWSTDGRSWHPLPMTGTTPPGQTYLLIARGQTVIVTGQADGRVYVGTFR
jgi:hypothetical protein